VGCRCAAQGFARVEALDAVAKKFAAAADAERKDVVAEAKKVRRGRRRPM
jgi:hypothetical protein